MLKLRTRALLKGSKGNKLMTHGSRFAEAHHTRMLRKTLGNKKALKRHLYSANYTRRVLDNRK